MDHSKRLEASRAGLNRKLEQRIFTVTWAGGGEVLQFNGRGGLTECSDVFNMSPSTLGNYISRGKGKYSTQRTNPTTGELDIVTVTRSDPPAKEKRPRGRPPSLLTLARRAETALHKADQEELARSLHGRKNHAKKTISSL